MEAKNSLTAYPRTVEALKERIIALDRESFNRPLSRCDLRLCQGTCCYDGVYLNEEEAQVIRDLVEAKREYFASQGAPIEGDPVVPGTWEGRENGRKTATRPYPFSSKVKNFPRHFENTRCVFLSDEGKCNLQLLAISEGKHPWYYKPATCWLHPIMIAEGVVTLPNEENDPHKTCSYPGYTTAAPCGAMSTGGKSAYETLSEELDFLGQICGFDIRAVPREP